MEKEYNGTFTGDPTKNKRCDICGSSLDINNTADFDFARLYPKFVIAGVRRLNKYERRFKFYGNKRK